MNLTVSIIFIKKSIVDPDFGIVTADYITHFENCVAAPTTVNDSMKLVVNLFIFKRKKFK